MVAGNKFMTINSIYVMKTWLYTIRTEVVSIDFNLQAIIGISLEKNVIRKWQREKNKEKEKLSATCLTSQLKTTNYE